MLDSLFVEEEMQPEVQRLPSETKMTSAAMEGYEACTEEAIRYLIEEEKVPADDPMVIGLREYLAEKQKSLSYTNLFDYQLSFSQNTSHPVFFNSFEGRHDYSGCNDYTLPLDVSDQSIDSDEVFNTSSDDTMTSESEMTKSFDAFDVNNLILSHEKLSAIRSLTEELLSLMEEEDDFYSEDEDDNSNVDDVIDDAMSLEKEPDN